VTGADGGDSTLADRIGLASILGAQAGAVNDMDSIADVLYGRPG
jgi:hypothetical protein